MALIFNAGDTKRSDGSSGEWKEERASSKGAATVQLFVARWAYGAVVPYFLRGI